MSLPRVVTHQSVSWLSRRSSQCCRKQTAISTLRAFSSRATTSPRLRTSATCTAWVSMSLAKPARALAARRSFSSTPTSAHGDITPPKPGEEVHVIFVDKEGDEHNIAVSKGDNLLDIAQANDIEMEGACGGSCACSTCHVIVEDEKLYDLMPEPEDDENDMLDLAFGLTETSRLGCQVVMTKELDGMRVKLPSMTRNMQASDFSKKNE